MKPSHIPNIITILRMLLIIPVVVSLLTGRSTMALTLFLIAGFSDALDGLLARRFQWTSRFGSIADPLADKVLLVCSFITLAWLGQIPWWLFIVVIARDLIILSGALAYHYLYGPYELSPTMISKVNTFCQIVLVILFLIQLSFNFLPLIWLDIVIYVVLTTSLLSLGNYVWEWTLRALHAKRVSQ